MLCAVRSFFELCEVCTDGNFTHPKTVTAFCDSAILAETPTLSKTVTAFCDSALLLAETPTHSKTTGWFLKGVRLGSQCLVPRSAAWQNWF